MKRFIALFLLTFLFPLCALADQDAPSFRALLIGCDTFFTQENTYPIAQNNLDKISQILNADIRIYDTLHTYYDEIGHEAAFRQAVEAAFSGAEENDVSLLYLSSHGCYSEETTGIYLCDGMEENILSPQALAAMLSPIPGTKLIMLDACNSGAFIHKGMDELLPSHPFTGQNVYIITSAGGCEASFQWQSEENAPLSGGSYFADVFAKGLSGHHSADVNKDGIITFDETYQYLCANYAASAPQRYPAGKADFPLYQYDPALASNHDKCGLTDITFEDTLLTAGQSDLHFSFTVHQPVSLYYQLIYYQNGAWNFENAQFFQDIVNEDGLLTPGRKQRSLHLGTQNTTDSGYAMIQFFTIEEEIPVFQGARLLCVQPERKDLSLQIKTAASFQPQIGEEMPLLVLHDAPCALSVSIRNEAGKTVKRLSYEQPSRPQQLQESASLFYWDGKDNQGRPLPSGPYTAYVQVWLGEMRYTAESSVFMLSDGMKEGL